MASVMAQPVVEKHPRSDPSSHYLPRSAFDKGLRFPQAHIHAYTSEPPLKHHACTKPDAWTRLNPPSDHLLAPVCVCVGWVCTRTCPGVSWAFLEPFCIRYIRTLSARLSALCVSSCWGLFPLSQHGGARSRVRGVPTTHTLLHDVHGHQPRRAGPRGVPRFRLGG
jgi:hypothetical protein